MAAAVAAATSKQAVLGLLVAFILVVHLFLFFKVANLNLFDCNKLTSGEIEPFENLSTGSSAHHFSHLL